MAPFSGHADGNPHDSPVPEDQMERDCQNEASAELGVRPNNISTRPVYTKGSDFVVSGESPRSGYNVTIFECVYGKRGMWKGFQVTGRGQNSRNNDGAYAIPKSVKDSCLELFDERADVTSVSPLRPGYWEVIMQSKASPRSVACTINDDAEIQEWTELN